tara:strand:- start:298 stop:831 length:534 start_codon:yes stop_codon:yes gene_type:complete
MSNTFTAQGLSDFYQKVADGGEAEFRANSTNKQWFSTSGSPCLSSVRQNWRIKPTKKVIDLSVLIESGIDCEFYDELDFDEEELRIGFLTSIDCSGHPYSLGCDVYSFCQPRMNHIHAWQGGECPIEGFVARAWYDKEDFLTVHTSFNSIDWSKIMYVEFLEVEHGYVMPWEVSDDF